MLEPVTPASTAYSFPIGVVYPLSPRDVLANGKQQYGIVFQYTLKLDDNVSKATLLAPRVHGVLYEATFDSQLLVVIDRCNRVVATSDTFPEDLSLKKGEYTVLLQVSHHVLLPLLVSLFALHWRNACRLDMTASQRWIS